LGVATIGEAAQIQERGIRGSILVMCALDPTEIEYCVVHGIDFLAWHRDQFELAAAVAERCGRSPRIHIDVDTGMSRSGIDVVDFEALVASLSMDERAGVVGVTTHFHSADLADLESSETQLRDFLTCVDVAKAHGLRPLVHAANSPATVRMNTSRLDMVRLGILAYGLPPSEFTPVPGGVAPILNWKAIVTNVKRIAPGRGVGYGWRYVADEPHEVATLGLGYADGYRRSPLGVNAVIVGDRVAPVIGSVFMDQVVFRVPEDVRIRVGDPVVLLGEHGAHRITAETLAERWATNNYDVVSGIRQRIPRRYV
jgi:alanine racemase